MILDRKDKKLIMNGSRLQFKFRIQVLPIQQINLKKLKKIAMEKLQTQCFICGNLSCLEDTDHKKLTFYQFDNFLRTKAGFQPLISKIKHKIRKCFRSYKQKCNLNLQAYEIELMLMVDKLHFWHIIRFSDKLDEIEAVIFGYMLPRKKMIKLLDILNRQNDTNMTFPKFDKLLTQIHKFKKNYTKIIQSENYGQLALTFSRIIKECQKDYKNEKNYVRGDEEIANINAGIPIKKEELIASQFIVIQGVPFSTLRRSVDLSILYLTDNVFLSNFTNIQKLRDLTQLQLRDSRLSQTCYRMLFNTLPNIQSIDLSHSNSQNFYQILAPKLPKLKTLYLNQTCLTDKKLIKILQSLKSIRVFYADGNNLTNQSIQYIFKNKKQLIYASMKGNKIQINLALKGGYLEY